MSLQEKVLRLKLEALMAARHAAFWQKLINERGEGTATAFYTHLGLNHLERKTFEWEGMRLSRVPKPHEQKALKGVAQAQDTAKEKISTNLLKLRTDLISDGLKGIKTLSPADYHALTLRASSESRFDLRDRLIAAHKQGRLTVIAELGAKAGSVDDDEFDDLDTLTDLTNSRVTNDVQARIIAAAARFALLGLSGSALIAAIQSEIRAGSVSYIDRASTGIANKVVNIGREDEANRRRGEWDRVEYSAILDQNVCEPCAQEDGTEADNEADLTPTPNPECLGGDQCRCFHVYVRD